MRIPHDEIRRRLPHGPPFLFLDDDCEIDEGARTATTTKRFAPDEPFFAGHFPGAPVVPGCILVETLAQLCGLLLGAIQPVSGLVTLARVEVKFRGVAGPDQTLTLTARHVRSFDNLHGFSVHCTNASGERITDGELTLATA